MQILVACKQEKPDEGKKPNFTKNHCLQLVRTNYIP